MNTKDFGKALLWYAKQNGVNDIGNLKLQKLAYYCQGYSLAINNESIFDEPIKAYDYGPVVYSLFQEYKGHKCITEALFCDGESCFNALADKFKNIIKYVIERLGGLSSYNLVTKTHNESPWLAHSRGINKADGKEITQEELKLFFTLELSKQQDDYFVKLLDALSASEQSVVVPKNQTEQEFLDFISSL